MTLKTFSFVKRPLSLQEPIRATEDGELGDLIANHASPAPSTEAIEHDLSDKLGHLLQCLTPREQEIIRRRFGMGATDEATLEELGEELHLTRERVRQIEARALLKLRKNDALSEMKCFLE